MQTGRKHVVHTKLDTYLFIKEHHFNTQVILKGKMYWATNVFILVTKYLPKATIQTNRVSSLVNYRPVYIGVLIIKPIKDS